MANIYRVNSVDISLHYFMNTRNNSNLTQNYSFAVSCLQITNILWVRNFGVTLESSCPVVGVYQS